MSAGYQPRRIPCGWRALAIHSFADRVVSRTEPKACSRMSSYLPSARSDDEHNSPPAPTAATAVASHWSRLAAETPPVGMLATETPPVGMKASPGNGPLRLTITFGPFRLAGKILMTSAPASLAAVTLLGVSARGMVVRPVSMMALATDSETPGRHEE